MVLPKTDGNRGLSLIELIIAMAILSILATVVLPLAEITVKRSNELELRQALREIRTAIDAYKADHDRAVTEKKVIASIGETGYPETLEILLEGTEWGGLYEFPRKYLRRIPVDPFARPGEDWGRRSYLDAPDSSVWGGGDVFDVYSESNEQALDGSYYREW